MPGDMFAPSAVWWKRLAGDAAILGHSAAIGCRKPRWHDGTKPIARSKRFRGNGFTPGFLQQAEAHPERIALIDGARRLTYGEVLLLAGDVAREIRAQGIQPNQLVAIVMEKGWEQAGRSFGSDHVRRRLFADRSIHAQRAHSAIAGTRRSEAGADAVAVDRPHRVACECRHHLRGRDRTARRRRRAIVPRPGRPGVCDLHLRLHRSAERRDGRPSCGSQHDFAISISASRWVRKTVRWRFLLLSFDLSVYDIFGLLAAGGAVVFPEIERIRDPEYLRELIQQERITIWNSVPSYMQMLVEGLSQDRSHYENAVALRLVMISGDWIPVGLPPRIRALAPAAQIISLGGATEASIWSICYPIGRVDRIWKSIPYGKPLSNQTFFVYNADMEDCPDGVPGELYIGGDGVALGYWRDEAKTAAKFRPTRSAARGCIAPATGALTCPMAISNSRNDLQVKIGGFRIELGEIDAALADAPGITAGLTVAHDDGWSSPTGGILWERSGSSHRSWNLSAAPSRKSTGTMIPSQFLALNEFPHSDGKVDRTALEKLAANGHSKPAGIMNHASDERIRSSLEEELTTIWCEVLRVPKVAIDQNFFEIGGNSFAAIQVHQRLCSRVATACSVTDLFRYPTVTGLAEYLSQTSQSTDSIAAIAVETDSRDPVSRRDRRMAARSMAASRAMAAIRARDGLFQRHCDCGGGLPFRRGARCRCILAQSPRRRGERAPVFRWGNARNGRPGRAPARSQICRPVGGRERRPVRRRFLPHHSALCGTAGSAAAAAAGVFVGSDGTGRVRSRGTSRIGGRHLTAKASSYDQGDLRSPMERQWRTSENRTIRPAASLTSSTARPA